MMSFSRTAILCGSTALWLPLVGGPAAAQQLTEACQNLQKMVAEAGDSVRDEFSDAGRTAKANDPQRCMLIITRANEAGGIGDPASQDSQASSDPGTSTDQKSFSASDTVTSNVQVKQKALVEGEVVVRLPDPEVSVNQPGPQVEVRQNDPSLTINEQAAQIVVRQQQASINVDMPQPTITIEQPAPEIVITMPRPGVSFERSQPQVDVRMADPKVTVTQGDPTLDVQVDAKLVDPDSSEAQNAPDQGVVARTERLNAQGTGASQSDAAVNVSRGDPEVNVVQPDQQAQYSYNAAQPNVRYEPADPKVNVTSEGQPRVQMRRVGEPKITFRQGQDQASADQSGQGQQMRQNTSGQQQRAGLTPEQRASFLGRSDRTANLKTQPTQVQVSDLVGMNVVTANGDDVGEISRVVTNNSKAFVVIQHGGFLGLGEEEVALPVRRIALQGNDALLLGLSEEELGDMPQYDPSQNQRVANDAQFEVRTATQ